MTGIYADPWSFATLVSLTALAWPYRDGLFSEGPWDRTTKTTPACRPPNGTPRIQW